MVSSKGLIKVGVIATRFNTPISYLSTCLHMWSFVASIVLPLVCRQNANIQLKGGELYTIVSTNIAILFVELHSSCPSACLRYPSRH